MIKKKIYLALQKSKEGIIYFSRVLQKGKIYKKITFFWKKMARKKESWGEKWRQSRIRKILKRKGKRLFLSLRKRIRRYPWLARRYRRVRAQLRDIHRFFFPPPGMLTWPRLLQISWRNLVSRGSRTLVTVGGVVVGVGAIVLLVSFGYGLQKVVTEKIIWPDALRVAEVTSESSQVKLNKEILAKVKGLRQVKKVEPSIRMAGQITFHNSKADVVVVAATNDYLRLSNLHLSGGNNFSARADKRFLGEADINKALMEKKKEGIVAGVATESAALADGDFIDGRDISFRLQDEVYVPIYQEPKLTSSLLGYCLGSILKSYQGRLVWGGVYDGLSGQGRIITANGQIKGKWLKAKLPLWQKVSPDVYMPLQEEGGQKEIQGFITLNEVHLLTQAEKEVEKILGNLVLGEATTSGKEATISSSLETGGAVQVGTQAAQLSRILKETVQEEEKQNLPDLSIRSEAPKEVIVSQTILRGWNKEAKDVLGEKMKIRYLLTNDLLPGITGRVFSQEVEYTIVGVAPEDKNPLIYVPLGDIESMGVNNYSTLKVLAASEKSLPEVRTVIQSLGLATRSVVDTLSQINRLFRIIRFLLGSFGAIAFGVALFGMFNTLTVSLLERTREIGVMKSLGTTNFDVARAFLTEAVLMSFLGGVGGIFLGGVLGQVINLFFFHFAQKAQSLFILPFYFAFLLLAACVLLGFLTGWYPSRRAAKISALNALRYE